MVEFSNNSLVALVLVTLVVAAAGTYVAYVNSPRGGSFGFTGFATQGTGNVTLTINNTLAIEVNASFAAINFGTCVPRPGTSYWCASDDAAECDGTFAENCTGDDGTAQFIQVENVGNVDAAVTLGSNCNATTLIGGTGPALQYITGNCNGTAVTTWTDLNAAGGLAGCTNITTVAKGQGRMRFYVNVTIPQDATGYNGACTANLTTITFTGLSAT